MDNAAGQPVCRREGLAPPSPVTGRLCVCVCLGGTWAPGHLCVFVSGGGPGLQAACVCVCLGGPGLQEGLDFYVPVLTLRVFSIESVAGYY